MSLIGKYGLIYSHTSLKKTVLPTKWQDFHLTCWAHSVSNRIQWVLGHNVLTSWTCEVRCGWLGVSETCSWCTSVLGHGRINHPSYGVLFMLLNIGCFDLFYNASSLFYVLFIKYLLLAFPSSTTTVTTPSPLPSTITDSPTKKKEAIFICWYFSGVNQTSHFIKLAKLSNFQSMERRKEMFHLTTHSTHFIYGYMASDVW